MAAYLVGVANITNPSDRFEEYAERAAKLMAEHGGELLVRGTAADIPEGDLLTGQTLIILKFPTMDVLKALYYSDVYQNEIKPLRSDAGIFEIGLFEGA